MIFSPRVVLLIFFIFERHGTKLKALNFEHFQAQRITIVLQCLVCNDLIRVLNWKETNAHVDHGLAHERNSADSARDVAHEKVEQRAALQATREYREELALEHHRGVKC